MPANYWNLRGLFALEFFSHFRAQKGLILGFLGGWCVSEWKTNRIGDWSASRRPINDAYRPQPAYATPTEPKFRKWKVQRSFLSTRKKWKLFKMIFYHFFSTFRKFRHLKISTSILAEIRILVLIKIIFLIRLNFDLKMFKKIFYINSNVQLSAHINQELMKNSVAYAK